MGWDRFWNSQFWDRAKKVGALIAIVAGLTTIAWFAYTIWKDRSLAVASQQSPQSAGSSVNLWTPTYVSGGFLLLATGFYLFATLMLRHSLKREIAELTTANETALRELASMNTARGEAVVRMEGAERDAKEANKRAAQDRAQKEIVDAMYQEEKAKYEKILWVTDIIGTQAKNLPRYVVIDLLSIVRVYLEDSTHGGPRICAGFRIRNNSIFPHLTVHWDEVKGHFSFRGKDLTEKIKPWHPRGSPNAHKLEYEQDGWVWLEQDLTAAETDRLENALESEAAIGFEGIEIDVSGGERFPDIGRHTLEIPEEFRRILLRDCKINGDTDNA